MNRLFAGIAGMVLLGAPALHAQPTTLDFNTFIQPIFVSRCTACHGAVTQRAGLRLDDREAALKGSMNGPVIVPGHSESSRLYAMVASKRMPLDDELSVLELNTLKTWIDRGAPGSPSPFCFSPPLAPTLPMCP